MQAHVQETYLKKQLTGFSLLVCLSLKSLQVIKPQGGQVVQSGFGEGAGGALGSFFVLFWFAFFFFYQKQTLTP